MPELKDLVVELQTSWKAFTDTSEDRIKAIEDRMEPDSYMTEVVNRINPMISDLQDKLDVEVKYREALEKGLNRPWAGGGNPAEMTKAQIGTLETWFRAVKNDADYELQTADFEFAALYNKQFRTWMRKGASAIPEIRDDLQVVSDPDGGFWVSPEQSGRIIEFARETSPMRAVANVETISSDALEGFLDLDTGVSGGWVTETATRAVTNTPQLGAWRIPVHEQYASPQATQKVLDDANRDIEGWLAAKTRDIMGRTENTTFVTGDGDGKPRGFTTHTDAAPTATTFNAVEQIPSTAAAALVADGLIELVAALKPIYRQNASFAMNRSTLFKVRKLKDGDGAYLWQPDFTVMRSGNLLGFPIVEFEDMADVSAGNLAVAFADWREAYTIVDRQDIRVLRDPFTSKPNVIFYTTKRVGGDVANFDAIKIQDIAAS